MTRRGGALLRAVRSIAVAGLAGCAIAAVGSVTWGALLIANLRTSPDLPWSMPATAVVLWLMYWYLNGHGWPQGTAELRRRLLRARPVPPRVFAAAGMAGLLSLVSLAGLWIVLVNLTGAGGNPTAPEISAYPALLAAIGILVASLVASLSEEAGFRGYCQVILERQMSGPWAVVFSSAVFALWHGPTQGFLVWKLLFFFLVGVSFGSIAYLTASVLPAIPVHAVGDILFFTLIWPYDAGRAFVWIDGTDAWFWIHAIQAVVFAALAVTAYRHLANMRSARGGPGS
jgi:membrane protease YdiL (CAAX protease family)